MLGSPLLADRCLDKMLDDKCKELELMMSRVQQLNSHYALTIVRNSFHFTDNLTFWTILTSGQPITGGSANKQRAWDEVYVNMVKTNLLSDCTTDMDHARLLAAFDQHSADWLHALRCPAVASFLTTRPFESRLLCALVPLCVFPRLPMWTNN